ncbi:MAG: ribonuclease HI family protein [Candidatus Magasanikbacteria bacterium]
MKLIIYSDGGARGNPGPAATGIVIKDEIGKTIDAFGEYLGEQTNNYAEYMALISGLRKAKELKANEVECLVDSKLVCEQLKCNWKVKEPTLQKLFVMAYNLSVGFKKVTYRHIPREKNKEADAEVNKVLDKIT